MSTTDFFIKRPVFSIALSLLIVFAGLFACFQLPLQLFPTVETPMITVSVGFPGGSAQTVQDFITNVVENSLSGIKGVNYITSSSTQGGSSVQIYMQSGVSADTALTDVSEKVNAIRGQLPQGINDPVISKGDSNTTPIFILAFTSRTLTPPQMSDYLTRRIKPELESIDGVAEAQILGNRYAMRVGLNPTALAAHHLSPADVVNALQAQNVQSSPGSLNGESANLNLSTNADIQSADQFNNIVIKNENDIQVHLQDVGVAALGAENDKISSFYNGEPAVMVFVNPQSGANPLVLANHIKTILPELQREFPAGLQMHEVVNTASFIKASIKEVMKTLVEALIIVGIVIFLFLGTFRAVLIPLVTIPISLIGICFFLLALGFSLNILTMLAMVIAIGLVVDDAIVVMENIFRYVEAGHSAMEAAILGTREIAFSVIAMTLTLAAIFAPIAFASGVTGKLFSEFAFSLAGCVIISGIVALTLSPMMCSRVINKEFAHETFVMMIEKTFDTCKTTYEKWLRKAFHYKKIFLIIWAVSILGLAYFYMSTPKELAPAEDEGFMMVMAMAPDSVSSTLLAKYSSELNQVYKQFPAIDSYVYINGLETSSQVLSFMSLKPWGERSISSQALQPMLQGALSQIAGLQAFAIVPPTLPGDSNMGVQFVLKSIGDYKNLYDVAQIIEGAARQSGLFMMIQDDLNYDQPVVKINIDRNAVAAMNVDVSKITDALSSLLSEGRLQYFNMQGQTYQVIPEAESEYRLNPDLLNNFQVRSNTGALIPLSALVTMQTDVQPASLNQFQKMNSVTFSAIPMPGHSISECLDFLAKMTKSKLPNTLSYDYAGGARQFMQEGNRMLWLFFAAFIAIFIVLSMQFESFRDPLIILCGSLPMALMAALLPMKLGFATINIYTQIGLLTLAGLISKHGILLVKFANTRRSEGESKTEAMIDACKIRLRPILMTTLAIVFGSMPLVMSSGAGSVSRFDMGIVIVCGMLIGTCFTLFVLPILYSYWSKKN